MTFDLQPVLKGDRVTLRPLTEADFEPLYAVASDPLIWVQHPQSNRFEAAVFRDFFADAMASGGALLAIESGSGTVIGSSRFHGYDEGERAIEIGWTFLARSHWGGAWNGEMKRLMLQHAFRFVDTVVFYIGTRNIRSQRAVEKIGGVRAGSRTEPDGEESFRYEISVLR